MNVIEAPTGVTMATSRQQTLRIGTIPGDGIGAEVVPAAMEVLERLGSHYGLTFEWKMHDWSCEYYTRTGQMMPKDGLDLLRDDNAIFLGAVGYPGVPDHLSLWGLLIPIRRTFQQYINLRPIKLLSGIESPLANIPPDGIDFIVVRENNEGEYSEAGGRIYRGSEDEIVIQESIFTARGVRRAMRFAYELAGQRRARLASATKSNGILHSMPFWDEMFRKLAMEFPEIETNEYHIDALAALFVLDPGRFDVVVASNLFGDILTDLGAALIGSIGISPSANINPAADHPSMFEPVHGSAPDIAGTGRANPIGQVWTGAMMLDHLGHPEAARTLETAIAHVLSETRVRTPDLGGTASTAEVTAELMTAVDTVVRAR